MLVTAHVPDQMGSAGKCLFSFPYDVWWGKPVRENQLFFCQRPSLERGFFSSGRSDRVAHHSEGRVVEEGRDEEVEVVEVEVVVPLGGGVSQC